MMAPGFKARRRAIEANHSWFNRFRKPMIRYEKLETARMALHHYDGGYHCLKKSQIIYG